MTFFSPYSLPSQKKAFPHREVNAPLFYETQLPGMRISIKEGRITYFFPAPFPVTVTNAYRQSHEDDEDNGVVVVTMKGAGAMSCSLQFPLPEGVKWEGSELVNAVDYVMISLPLERSTS